LQPGSGLLTENLTRLILYEPPLITQGPSNPPDVVDRIQSLVDRGELEAALEVFLREIVKMPEYELKDYRQLPMWEGRVAMVPTIAREIKAADRVYRLDPAKFSNLQIPVLLLLGGDSPPLFKNAVETLHNTLPNSKVVVMQGQQHIAMDRDPEMFSRVVIRFMDANSS
jgi:pimeloyl-ACP methyl ester carboxylesterase